ncbi:tetratricopeptide repeat protein [Bradyrhizobium erythrophlei]|uniref:tetratricopeptide repeat protein n=1 Tax=Bradyrhizobium erythrophlei TaxID=1437360 RepID=UPI0035EA7276
MLQRSGIITTFILFCWTAGSGHAFADDQCSVTVFETNAGEAAKNCTAVLDGGRLTKAAHAEALKIRVRALHRMGRLDEAIKDYEKALSIAPDDPELHLRRGWTAYDQRDFDTVFAQAHGALKLKPGYADVYGLIGAALSLGGPEKFAQAKVAYDEAIRLQPLEPLHRFNRLWLLKRNDFHQEAIQEADAILALPEPLITRPSAVTSYLRSTTYRIAVAMERALLLRTVGRIDEARQAYDRAIELDPDAQTFAWRAEFRLTQAAYIPGAPPPSLDAVQDDLTKALALAPDYWFSLNQQAHVHFIGHQYELAAEEYARALKGYPINGTMRWKYAITLRKLGRGEEAAAEAITSFNVDPGFMEEKLGVLQKRGYLAAIPPDTDPRPALMDAVRACMLDEDCG